MMLPIAGVVIIIILYLLYKEYKFIQKEEERVNKESELWDKATEHLDDLQREENTEKVNLKSAKKQNDIHDVKTKITKQENKNA